MTPPGKDACRMAQVMDSKSNLFRHELSWNPMGEARHDLRYHLKIISDVTEARMLRKKIRASEEAYRRQISRELHDGIGQALNTMGLYVSLAKETLGQSQQAVMEHLSKLESLLERTVDETHRLAMDMRPSVLDDMGLVPALRFLCKDVETRTGMEICLRTNLAERLRDREVETALYRMTQEGLCNIEKHASATRSVVKLDQKNPKLTLLIQDNGSGFDVQEASNQGMGLMGMQERASLLGGQVTIKSKRDQGTEIRIEVFSSNVNGTEVGPCPRLLF